MSYKFTPDVTTFEEIGPDPTTLTDNKVKPF